MRIVGRVDLRDQGFETGLMDDEGQMGRPIIVATGGADKFADRAIDRDRIAGGLDGAEMQASGLIRNKTAPQIHLGLLGILVLVESLGVRVPHVGLGASDWPPLSVLDRDANKKPRTPGRR